MVKATNNAFQDFVFDPQVLKIPERYQEEPIEFLDFTWITQDNRILKIRDFDDNHLVNLFKMLANTILYGKELQTHKRLSYEAASIVKVADYNLKYVGHELHLRQLAYSTRKLTSTKLTPQQ